MEGNMAYHDRNLHKPGAEHEIAPVTAEAIFASGAERRHEEALAYSKHIAAPGQREDVYRRFLSGLEAVDRQFALQDAWRGAKVYRNFTGEARS
jgi:hypothetical protein